MESFETERLLLRAWRPEDLDDFYAYCKDPAVGPNAGWKPHENKEESRRILRSFLQNDDTWALELKENGRAVGSLGMHRGRLCGLFPGPGEGREIGYALARAWWGRGLMPEAVRGAMDFAFRKAGLEYLVVAHFPSNARSKRVIEKCGFRYLKTLHGSYADYRGVKRDEVVYRITKEEYPAGRAG